MTTPTNWDGLSRLILAVSIDIRLRTAMSLSTRPSVHIAELKNELYEYVKSFCLLSHYIVVLTLAWYFARHGYRSHQIKFARSKGNR